MIIGQINYINLLPFTLFVKKNNPYLFKIMQHHKGYPTQINKMFLSRKIQAGFISSIASQKQYRLGMGIIAKKEVLSVLICSGENAKDIQSSSSNVLADILGEKGKVVIGDNALKIYFNSNNCCKDLANIWYEKYNLPFIFAVFCANSNIKFYKNFAKSFLKKNIKIPQYVLEKYSKNTTISKKNILLYLSKIFYKINIKEEKALKKFFLLNKEMK